MELKFNKVNLPPESQILIDWLSSSPWPFHGNPNLSPEKVQSMISDGVFDGENHQTFWVLFGESRVGCIRLFDLEDIGDGAPLFDIRLKPESRGHGIGVKAVQWLVQYMFEQWPALHRIEGTTRQDNIGMRKVFEKCHFAKEGHLRNSWKTQDGDFRDAILYGILREDWQSGKVGTVNWEEV